MGSSESHTVYEAFAATAAVYPDRDFLHIPAAAANSYSHRAIDLTYREVGAHIEAARKHYQAAGYGPGHRVALMLRNRPAFFVHWLALNSLGAGVVPINDDYIACVA